MIYSIASEKIAILEVQGSITAANAEAFREQLMERLAIPMVSMLLVDMAGIEFLDSAGLMAIVTVYRLARSLNKRLSFCAVPPSVRIVFELTQLDGTFEIHEDRAAYERAVAV